MFCVWGSLVLSELTKFPNGLPSHKESYQGLYIKTCHYVPFNDIVDERRFFRVDKSHKWYAQRLRLAPFRRNFSFLIIALPTFLTFFESHLFLAGRVLMDQLSLVPLMCGLVTVVAVDS
jgi:hypothetical protein